MFTLRRGLPPLELLCFTSIRRWYTRRWVIHSKNHRSKWFTGISSSKSGQRGATRRGWWPFIHSTLLVSCRGGWSLFHIRPGMARVLQDIRWWREIQKVEKYVSDCLSELGLSRYLLVLLDELLAIILKTATEQMQPFLGSPLALTADWLQPNFPSRPPPGYMRSGYVSPRVKRLAAITLTLFSIALTDDGISWVTQPLDPEIGDRLQTFMKPVHVALAIKDAYYVLLKRQMDRLRNPDGQPGSVKLLDGRVTLSGHERTNALSTQEQAKLQPPVSDAPTETVSNDEPQLHPSSIISFLQRLPLPDLGPGSDLHLASIAFKLRLHEHQAKSPRTPNRGSFFLVGPVGLQGPKGACRFEVRGEYDPAKPGWRTVDMKLRDWSYYVHKPRRWGWKQYRVYLVLIFLVDSI